MLLLLVISFSAAEMSGRKFCWIAEHRVVLGTEQYIMSFSSRRGVICRMYMSILDSLVAWLNLSVSRSQICGNSNVSMKHFLS